MNPLSYTLNSLYEVRNIMNKSRLIVEFSPNLQPNIFPDYTVSSYLSTHSKL